MNMDLAKHPFFTPWTDPQSGVVSFILTQRIAPIQQSLYFVTPGITPDEKWMWFTCAFAPSPHKTLGLVSLDAANPIIRHFPQAQMTTAHPMVCPDGQGIWFGSGPTIFHMDMEGRTRPVIRLPDQYIAHRRLTRMATHLTLSADGRHLLLDGHIGNHWFVGTGDIHTGQVHIIKEFAHHYNHAQFSPTVPDLFLIAQDWFFDPVSGRRFHYDNRIWLMNLNDTRFDSLTPHVYCKHMTGISHEWWSADGRICYVDYEQGAFELDINTHQSTHVWQQPLCHAHCSRNRQYWCADESPYKWTQTPCQVRFFNRQTGKITPIASALPLPQHDRGLYHIDPHPQFSPQDRWITYTTTVRGMVDVALTATEALT